MKFKVLPAAAIVTAGFLVSAPVAQAAPTAPTSMVFYQDKHPFEGVLSQADPFNFADNENFLGFEPKTEKEKNFKWSELWDSIWNDLKQGGNDWDSASY